MADNGVTYNSSVTYQHAVAHNPDVRTQPCQTPFSLEPACEFLDLERVVVS